TRFSRDWSSDVCSSDLPEVKQVFGKAGRSNSATDPAPLAMLETWVELKPKDQWRDGMTMEKLIKDMDKSVHLPGMRNVWGYPIRSEERRVGKERRTRSG